MDGWMNEFFQTYDLYYVYTQLFFKKAFKLNLAMKMKNIGSIITIDSNSRKTKATSTLPEKKEKDILLFILV
jgi:hypothetical protein